MAKDMGTMDWIAFVFVMIGALNWGLAIFNLNVVSAIFGSGTFTRIIYALVGLSGLWMIYKAFK